MSRHQNFAGRLITATAHPSNPVQGNEYVNTSTNVWARYDGAAWRGTVLGTTSTSTSTTTSSSTSTTTTSTSTS